MSAWLYQDDKQLKKVGSERATWYVCWLDSAAKRRRKSSGNFHGTGVRYRGAGSNSAARALLLCDPPSGFWK
jgi:hypothetical protein